MEEGMLKDFLNYKMRDLNGFGSQADGSKLAFFHRIGKVRQTFSDRLEFTRLSIYLKITEL